MRSLTWTAGLTSLALVGCTQVADFDRNLIPTGDAKVPDGATPEGGAGDAAQDGGRDGGGDGAQAPCGVGDHSGCASDQLCCSDGAGPPSCEDVGPTQCTACGVACDEASSSACVDRQCRCGDGPACSGDTPLCDDAAGKCVACLSDADCSGTTPVCNGAGTCEACTQSPDNCPAPSVCLPDGSCKGCGAPHIGCDNPTPICNSARNECEPCERDDQCSTFGGDRSYCASDGTCAVCDDDTHSGCEGATPYCGKVGDGFLCQDCTADSNNTICGDRICDATRAPAEAPSCQVCNYLDASKCPADKPFCDDAQGAPGSRTCVGCRDHEDCAGGEACLSNSCAACSEDADCAGHPDGAQCVGGACRACDPDDHAGCEGETPRCSESFQCRACLTSDDCAGGLFCDPADGTCKACGEDGDCAGHSAGGQCVAGVCQLCDPADHQGCANPDPICDVSGASPSCVPCSDAPNNCTAPLVCIGGQCTGCQVPFGGCTNPTPVCNGDQCVACQSHADCMGNPAGNFCSDGRCGQCDKDDSAGTCTTAELPFCGPSGETFTCQPCTADTSGAICGAGVCDTTHGPATCQECNYLNNSPGCGNLCRCTGLTPFCDDAEDAPGSRTCVECLEHAHCDTDKACVGNACVDCSSNADCAGHSGGEVCVARDCRPCDPADDDGCAGGQVCVARDCLPCDPADDDGCAGGQVCVAGTPNACQLCDPADDRGCAGGQRCKAGSACVECLADGDCSAPGSGECVSDSCRACDPADDAGCGTATEPAQCGDDFRCFCASDTDCASVTGRPNCDIATGDCHACVDDADCGTDQCVDHVCQPCDPADDAGCAGQQCVVTDAMTGAVACRACDPADNAGCGTATLPAVCDMSSFTCTCGDDDDCATVTGRPKCAPASSSCVECLADADCSDAAKPLCEGNACLPCDDPAVTGDADARCDAKSAGTTCDTSGGATDGQCVI